MPDVDLRPPRGLEKAEGAAEKALKADALVEEEVDAKGEAVEEEEEDGFDEAEAKPLVEAKAEKGDAEARLVVAALLVKERGVGATTGVGSAEGTSAEGTSAAVEAEADEKEVGIAGTAGGMEEERKGEAEKADLVLGF